MTGGTGPARRAPRAGRSGDLQRANELMVEALRLLDAHACHHAAAHLDLAIVRLGLRPDEEVEPAD